jgi:HPt (histidine-containing phosphotransfer) domain-containing protein
MIESGDWDSAGRSTHTLRGLCATLGASRVLNCVTALETALTIRNGIDETYWLANTRAELDVLVAALDEQLEPDGAADMPVPANRTASGAAAHGGLFPPDAAPWVNRLRTLLMQGDNDARDVWDQHKSALLDDGNKQTIHDLSIAIENFDFDRALTMLGSTAAD